MSAVEWIYDLMDAGLIFLHLRRDVDKPFSWLPEDVFDYRSWYGSTGRMSETEIKVSVL